MKLRLLHALLLPVSLLALGACGSIPDSDVIDPSGKLSRDDYLDLRHRQENAPKQRAELNLPPIPNLSTATVAPVKLPGHNKRVSVTVTDNVPLRDVLIELAREAKVNLELDPRVQGGIIFSAHEQPFDDVLRRICALAGLRVKADGDYIHIELDEKWTPQRHDADIRITSVTENEVQLVLQGQMQGEAPKKIALKPHQIFRAASGQISSTAD